MMLLMQYGDAVRTTVSIDDELLAAARRRAAERGQTLGQVVEDALRHELVRRPRDLPPLPVLEGTGGLRPGVDLSSNRAIAELLDGPA